MAKSYMTVDDRCSGGKLVELDTVACKHCSAQMVSSRIKGTEGEWCSKCSGYVCFHCVNNSVHTNIFEALEKSRRKKEFLKAVGVQE